MVSMMVQAHERCGARNRLPRSTPDVHTMRSARRSDKERRARAAATGQRALRESTATFSVAATSSPQRSAPDPEPDVVLSNDGADVFPDVDPAGAVNHIRSRAGCRGREGPLRCPPLARPSAIDARRIHRRRPARLESSSAAQQPMGGRSRRYAPIAPSRAAPEPNYSPRDDSADVSTDASSRCQ